MFRLLVCLVLCNSQSLLATIINQTQITLCSTTFTNCTDNITSNNCTADFFGCMQDAEMHTKQPQSCYQAEAAGECFQTAVKVSIGIFGASILAAAMPTIINWIHSARCWGSCCGGCNPDADDTHNNAADGEPADSDTFALKIPPKDVAKTLTNLDYLKKLSSASFGQIASYFSIAISFASVSQLFTLWQAWTTAQANCAFDLAK